MLEPVGHSVAVDGKAIWLRYYSLRSSSKFKKPFSFDLLLSKSLKNFDYFGTDWFYDGLVALGLTGMLKDVGVNTLIEEAYRKDCTDDWSCIFVTI